MDDSDDDTEPLDHLISLLIQLKEIKEATEELNQQKQEYDENIDRIITEELNSMLQSREQEVISVSGNDDPASLDRIIDEEITRMLEMSLDNNASNENSLSEEQNECISQHQDNLKVNISESDVEDFEIVETLSNSESNAITQDNSNITFNCSLCLETHSINESETLGCSHIFCRMCLSNFLICKVNDGQVLNIECPEEGCSNKASDWMIRSLLPPDKRTRYESFVFKRITEPLEDVMNCPQCNELVECDLAMGNGICLKCNFAFCTSCSKEFHGTDDCPDISQRLEETAQSESLIQQSFKKCPGCNTSIEKDEHGCNHITCARCSVEFCWICLTQITDLESHYTRCQLFNYDND